MEVWASCTGHPDSCGKYGTVSPVVHISSDKRMLGIMKKVIDLTTTIMHMKQIWKKKKKCVDKIYINPESLV